MRALLLLLVLTGMVGAANVWGQITPNGNTGTSTTAYTNGMPNDPIYIWCNYGIGTNGASLTATPPSGTGPWTFRWYYHNQATSAWSLYTTTTGTSSTISNLPSDGYRVEIFTSANVLVGCYTAWAWNMNATIDVAANPSSCNSTTLGGTLNVASSFSYYNPPPPESIINAATQITVCFRANHTYVSDLAFYLVGPASCGSPVILLSPNPGAIGQNNICNSGNNVNNLCFQKGSTAILNVCTAAVPLSGTYGRYGPGGTTINWNPLNGCNAAAGGWRVQIYDCIGQDVGALTNATISFSNLTSVCGSPTTINYNSGNISSAINDNSCSAASASIFQVPPAVTLTTPITINANTSYQWTASPSIAIPNSTSSLTPTVSNIPIGTTTFTLTATVSYGGASCTYTDSAPFTNTCCTAVSNAGPDIAFCSGGSGTIGTPAVPGRTYSWSPTTGLSSSTVAQPTVTLTNGTSTPQTTNYTLTVTNTVDGGCTATDQVAVTVNPAPVATATPASQTICSGTAPSIALTSVPAGATFAWTVAQSGVTGASNGSGSSINQVLTASGPSAGTATYTITPTIGSCPGTPIAVTITVNPVPVATATPANQTICAGTAPGIALSSVPAGATFNWTISQTGASGASNGTGNNISQTLTATGSTPGTVVYSVVPTVGTCSGAPLDVTITVNPSPVATATPGSQTICSGTSTSISLASVPAGATFDWTVVQNGVTGASNGIGNNISQVLTASATGTATYTITPTIGTCPGAPITVTITVNPTPVITATPTAQTICSGTAPNIALSSVPAGATFDWTVVQSDVTGASAGNGASISQTLTASGSTSGTAAYTVTPTIGSCPGTPTTVTITVNPTPVATATPANQAICSGTATGIALSSVPAGATFDWTVVQSGVTGASNGTGSNISQTLNTSGTASGTATYTVTPTIGTCPGVPITVTVTVNPVPVATATPAIQTICSGTATSIALSSVPAGATFDWTVAQSGVSGASNGNGTSISQVLNTTGTAPGTATYTVTPTLGTCAGTPVTITITVNPTPVATATPASQTICSGTATGIALSSVPAGATFDWTVVQAGVTGASNGNGTSIGQTLNTSGAAPGTATYTITPTMGTCPGTPVTVTITVNPVPVAAATPATQAICSGTATNIALSSIPAGATFDWTVVQSGVTGASNGTGSNISQTLSTAGITGTATYTVTPALGGCPGAPITVTITVNPTPAGSATPASQAICSGTATNIALSSVPTGASFSWTISQTGASGASNGTGNTISQTLTATGAAAGTVIYTVTPSMGSCPGAPFDVTITVNPTPVMTATPAAQTICSGTATNIALTSAPAGATFDWTVTQSGVTGASAGSGNTISQALSTSGTLQGTATYTITPTLGTCPGTPVTVTITVNPVPVATATPAVQTICSGTAPSIALTSVPTGATFDWTVAQSGVTGASNGNGTSISQTLNTTGTAQGTATYTVTPMLGACAGIPVTVTVTVNPVPVVTATPAVQTICSGAATSIALTSVPTGATFDWTVAQSGVTGASNGSGASISQTLNTTGSVQGTATYTVTPTLGACPGTPVTVTITVNPVPVVTATPSSQSICSGTAPNITLTSVPAGATFDWTVVQNGTTGASNGTGSTISQTLSTAGVIGTATYTVTPTLGVCPGAPATVTITVNPVPAVTATPASQTICSGTAPNIALTSVPAGATFNWTAAQSGVTGASNGNGTPISQTLSTSGTVQGTATYTVTPSLGTCMGSPATVTITVDPTPVMTATPASQTICSGTAPNIALTSVPAGATFDWTVVQAGVTGASNGNGASISQTLNTTGSVQGTATYTITPTLGVCPGAPATVTITVNPVPAVTATPASQTICSGTAPGIALTSVPAGATFDWTVNQSGTTGASAGTGNNISQTLSTAGTVQGTATYTITPTLGTCVGTPVTVTITVNPTPVMTATPASQAICSGTAPSIALTSVPAGATFDWTVVQSGVTGASNGNGTSISQTLTTSSTAQGTATYTITPTLGVCTGTPVTVTITVNSVPVVTATPSSQTICSGTAPSIALTSVPAGATFDWTVTGNGTTGASNGSGSTISQTLSTAGAAQGTATYTITPTLGTCSGTPVTVTITVNPVPVVTATPSSQTICSGTAPGIALTSAPAGATFSWTVSESGVTGASAGTGSSISQVLTAAGAATGTATYSITPSLAGCAGLPVAVVITVNPLPSVVATPTAQSVCSGQATGITLTSLPAGSTFTWTAAASGASGSANGTGASIAQTLNNPGPAAGTVTYSITPSLAGCTGPVASVTVTVNANPVVIATPALPSICAGSSVTLTASGAVNYTWTPSTGLSSTTGSSVTASPASTQGYAIQGTDGNGCQATANVIVTVNPVPVTTASGGGAICEGGSANLTAGGATSYSWSPSTGLNTTTGANVTATPALTTTYTVTGTSLGCSSTATVTVTVNTLPSVNAGADITVCNGSAVVLAGSGTAVPPYIWSGGITDGVPFTATSTTTYTVVGTGQNGCTASDQVTVTVVNAPVISVVPSTSVGCTPVNVIFQNNTQGAVSYSWDFGDGSASTLVNPSHTYLATGCFDVTLTASTAGGCSSTSTFPSMICVDASPTAAFLASPSTVTIDNPVSSMINLSENASSYSWDFGDGSAGSTDFSPTHTFPGNALTTYEIMLVAYSPTGCTDTAWARIETYEDILYFVPNTFTPDGDDYNQVFKPVFTTGFDPYAYTLLIHNRWGQVMFESHDASVGWSGTYGEGNEIVMDGTYTYTIEFKVLQTGERKKINGHVNVLR